MNSSAKTERIRDYRLNGAEAEMAVEKGLAEAKWYTTDVNREKMRELLVRKNGPAIRDTLLWFGLIFGSGYLVFLTWGTWWVIMPYIIYSVLYASSSDSRWHEASHGTAFKTDWMNKALYEIASFMVMRQSVSWRWSHTRHHSDTIIRGRDPEIAVPRPPKLWERMVQMFVILSIINEFKLILKHTTGKIDAVIASYMPATENKKLVRTARIYLLIYVTLFVLSIYYQSWLPLFYVGLSNVLGSWLMVVYGTTQHAGLAENVLDHRLNCRTVYMNRINRFLYWNMNYHVEHHMFPLVPYHALPQLHELIKHDCPKPYNGLLETYKEIIPTLIKQAKDTTYYAQRDLPATAKKESRNNASHVIIGHVHNLKHGWIEVGNAKLLDKGDVIRFDFAEHTYAIYRTNEDEYYATEGICTHGNMHLAEGLVIGKQIECAKHNGRFNLKDGSVGRPPVCVGLKTYAVKIETDIMLLNIGHAEGVGLKEEKTAHLFEVVSNINVATYIKELVLRPKNSTFLFKPGEYMQLEIPAYENTLEYVEVPDRFKKEWKDEGIFRYFSHNKIVAKRNYSFASNPKNEQDIRFNIRLAIPPEGLNCSAGVGSSYVFNLKAGDTVKAFGPFGDFHIKKSEKEMVYIGGGAGMAPLRSHISYLLETQNTQRNISFWYGARSLNELFYQDYFERLEKDHKNFSFHIALSEPKETDKWNGLNGYIHEAITSEYLSKTDNLENKEFYLCGPPAMIKRLTESLAKYGVGSKQISFDEF